MESHAAAPQVIGRHVHRRMMLFPPGGFRHYSCVFASKICEMKT